MVDLNKARADILTLTRGSGDIWRLAGPYNAGARQAVYMALTGEKLPRAKTGVNALMDTLIRLSGATGSCPSDLEDNVIAWLRKGVDDASI